MSKKVCYVITILILILSLGGLQVYAAKTTTTKKKCTHRVYSTGSPATYHYSYCSKCGKCDGRERHSEGRVVNYGSSTYHVSYCWCGRRLGVREHYFNSYSRYSDTQHKARCSCGYETLQGHNSSPRMLNAGDVVLGTRYSSKEDLDKYHKMVCDACGTYTGVETHNWSGGSTSAHTCSSCSYVHSKKNDATQGRHYFNIDTIRAAGNVAPCVVCGEYLTLTYSSNSKLPNLPKKEEYTMVGNPHPMREVTMTNNEDLICNFMPINESGQLLKIDEMFLRVRRYTNGNYYAHYSKLIGKELEKITEKIGYIDSNTLNYITNKMSEVGALGGYNDSAKEEIIKDLHQQVKQDSNLNFIDVSQVSNVISQLGDFAVGAIDSPLMDWFSKDSTIKSTWLAGETYTLRQSFSGSMYNASNRKFTIYFADLSSGKYEILMSPVLTYGIQFNLLNYSSGGFTNMLFSTLFNRGGSKVGRDEPSNIKAYIGIAYRDTNGNVILNKDGRMATPVDSIISKVVYSGTSAHTVTSNVSAEMEWTQIAGYRYKGYLVKYGNGYGGNYSIYNNPAEMTVTTNSTVSVNSSFSYSGFGISIVFYYEPVYVKTVNHVVGTKIIDTNKNISDIKIPSVTNYDTSKSDFAPKSFPSLNKNFWPGYILTGYTIYKDSISDNNIIAKQTFDVNTTSIMNSKGNDKRYATFLTAINSSSDINGATIVRKENIGYGNDKIVVFHYLYPEVEIKNINYNTGKIMTDLNGENLHYTIKLIGDNMLVKSLDTTKPRENGYNEMNVNLASGGTKHFKYDASDFSLVQAWIYTKDLNKGTKTLYKVIAGNNTFVPSSVPKNKLEMASDFSSFANAYILNTEELMTIMNKVWSDLYIEFKYYQGANIVNVSYIDEEGNTLMPSEVYKILDKENGNNTATIPVTEIDGYELIKYVLDDTTHNDIKGLKNVKVIDNGNDRELIFIYRKKVIRPEMPDIYDNPLAIIRSNDKGNEEYNVDDAMPTDEDLYANVVTDSYIIENVLSVLNKKQSVNVILKKKYYANNNNNESGITSNIETAYATIPLIYDLDYKYYGGANANLFILDNAVIDNESVMDTKHYKENGKVKIEANYGENTPFISYIPGGKLTVNSSEQCTLIKDGDTYYLEILLDGIDYEKPNMNAIVSSYEKNHLVIDNIIRENSVVNGDYLTVTAEGKRVTYLDGINLYMSASRLADVIELADAGYYYKDSIAPLVNGSVLFNDRNVYTYTKAENKVYPSTKLTVTYVIHQSIKNYVIEEISGDENRVKEYLPSQIKMNSISIHTPIVNYTELIPKTNENKDDNQLIDETIENVLTLDSVFSILIPHGGMHYYAVNKSGNPLNGYGDKAYNYGGNKLYDEDKYEEKGLRLATFAKMKLVKFSFDVYAIKFESDGTTVRDKKLIVANTWFNLGELDKRTGLNIEKYNFIIPTWVKDKNYGDVSVRIVAANTPTDYNVKADIEEGDFISKEVSNNKDVYVLQKDFKVYIAGVLYDLEIRDSDDVGWMGNLKTTLKLANQEETEKNLYLPIGQYNQNYFSGYNMGLKLGYRFYFDLKTKGTASDEVIIKPNFYYVSKNGGNATNDISLFYNTVTNKYIKLNADNDLDIKMIMSNTHGNVNNTGFNYELMYGKINNIDKNYTAQTTIGSIFNGLDLKSVDAKLPRNNILECANLYGYKGNTTTFMVDAKKSELVESEKDVRNSSGHWYGEFYLPASTRVLLGKNKDKNDVLKNENNLLKDGYIIVTFDTIITNSEGTNYLSYSKPNEESRWEKEGTEYNSYTINLPNGNKATIPNIKEGAAMAIYEVSLRANDDYETEGTH